MIWDDKYVLCEPIIICPVCGQKLNRTEWDDFGMHYQCTEYFKMKRFLEHGIHKELNQSIDSVKSVMS